MRPQLPLNSPIAPRIDDDPAVLQPVGQPVGGRVALVRRHVARVGPAGVTGILILLIFAFTFFEGALRKWVFVGNAPMRYAAYFSKDALFVLAGLVGAGMASRKYRRLAGTLIAVSIPLLLIPSMANIGRSNPVGAILSLRSYLIIPCCVFLATGTIRSMRDIDRVMWLIGITCLGIAGLSVVQYYLPPDHVLNRYDTSAQEASVVFSYGHVRATGTFSYISGLTTTATICAWSGLYLFLSSNTWLRRTMAVAVIVGGLICTMTTQARTGLFTVPITLVGGLMLFRSAREAIYLGLILLIVMASFGWEASETEGDPGMVGALLRRIEHGEGVANRLDYNFQNFVSGAMLSPLGEGLGIGQQGGNFAAHGARSWGGGYESEYGRICFEVGLLGFAAVMIWRLTTLYTIWTGIRRSRDRRIRALACGSLAAFGLFCTGGMAFNHTGLAFGCAIASLALAALALPENRLAKPAGRRGTRRGRPPAIHWSRGDGG